MDKGSKKMKELCNAKKINLTLIKDLLTANGCVDQLKKAKNTQDYINYQINQLLNNGIQLPLPISKEMNTNLSPRFNNHCQISQVRFEEETRNLLPKVTQTFYTGKTEKIKKVTENFKPSSGQLTTNTMQDNYNLFEKSEESEYKEDIFIPDTLQMSTIKVPVSDSKIDLLFPNEISVANKEDEFIIDDDIDDIDNMYSEYSEY
jgi:hypothetical protein